MNTFNKYLDTHIVTSSDGRTVNCKYRQHEFFDISRPIFFHLHFIFVHFTADRVYTQGYLLNQSYCSLFDYLSQRKINRNFAEVSLLTDINAEIFNGFQLHIKKLKQNIFFASVLKNALKSVAEATGQIPFIQLPIVDLPTPEKTEPLTPEAFGSLSSALTKHIDSLYEKIEFRKKVEAAKLYEFETIAQRLVSQPYSRQNIFRWFQHKLAINSQHIKRANSIKYFLERSDDPELFALSSQRDFGKRFKELYNAECSKYLLDIPVNPFEKDRVQSWVPNNARAIKTLLTNGYPMGISTDDINEYWTTEINALKRCNSIIKLLLHRFTSRKSKNPLHRTPDWDELLAMYFPNMMDMSAIVVFIMLQSGWNKETVLAIDSNNFEDIFNGMINESLTVVFSEKERSQSIDTPFFKPKRFSALSTKDDKYSIHNLILLAKELSIPLKNYRFDFISKGTDESELNPLFLCIRYYTGWATKGGRHTSASYGKAFVAGTKQFLKQYPIFENGDRLTTPGEFTLRLRPTWMKFNRKKNPLSILALQQGHDDTNTTDVYYDSSGTAMQERYKLLRSELESIVSLLRRREFSGIMGKAATELSKEELKLFTIPGASTSIWGCSNQLRPDWPGHQKVIASGEKCYEISKCIFCSKIRIFEDSLPYLIERLQQICEKSNEFDEDVVGIDNDEVQIIRFVLDNWSDDDAIRRAARIQQRNAPLLPNDLSSLKLIFSEQDKS